MHSIDRAGRRLLAIGAGLLLVAISAAPALACGGLIGPNGAVNLLRTTTFAGYHDGEEHYVTAFEFAGGGGAFGSLTPLPGIPSSVEKGGDWTLQRLRIETDPQPLFELAFPAAAGAARDSAEVLMEVTIDALDITVLRGGAAEVGQWATDHGFRLPPDAPEVLDFYASRSPIFLAASFDANAAAERGQQVGDGTPVHITIPTDNPWVPLRILALGKTGAERVEADVYLMTDRAPALLPVPDGANGLTLDHSARASDGLLADLRSDRGMEWIPGSAWLSKIAIDAEAAGLGFDLAIDASGNGVPSRVAAGIDLPGAVDPTTLSTLRWVAGMAFIVIGVGGVLMLLRHRPDDRQGVRPA
jgi:Uncharacterized protein conserved in bacteria (DUF2330)